MLTPNVSGDADSHTSQTLTKPCLVFTPPVTMDLVLTAVGTAIQTGTLLS